MEPTVHLNHKRQLHPANQQACQAQMETLRMFERIHDEKKTIKRIMHQIAWKWRNNGEFDVKRRERARQLRRDELHAQKKDEISTLISTRLRSELCKTKLMS